MTNPVLRKLSNPKLSASEVADLLEKHVGTSESEYHCGQALEALVRLKDERASLLSKVVLSLSPSGDRNCKVLKFIIDMLRSDRFNTQ